MSEIEDWITERRRIHGAATEGPWEAGSGWVFTSPIYPDDNRLSDVFGMSFADAERQSDEKVRGQLNTESIVDAHNSLPRALTVIEEVLKLHRPVTRYSLVGDEGWSFDSLDEVREFTGEDDLPELYEFQLCVECRRVEDGAANNAAEVGYETSLWPCATAEAMGEGKVE